MHEFRENAIVMWEYGKKLLIVTTYILDGGKCLNLLKYDRYALKGYKKLWTKGIV